MRTEQLFPKWENRVKQLQLRVHEAVPHRIHSLRRQHIFEDMGAIEAFVVDERRAMGVDVRVLVYIAVLRDAQINVCNRHPPPRV